MMLAFSRQSASVTLKDFSPSAFFESLTKVGFEPVIYSFKKNLVERLGLTLTPEVAKMLKSDEFSDLLVGEVFFPAEGACCYLKVTGKGDAGLAAAPESSEEDIFADPGTLPLVSEDKFTVEIGEFAPMGSGEGVRLEALASAVAKGMGADLKWKDLAEPSARKLKGKSIETPSERDIELASILQDRRLSNLLNHLKHSDSVVLDDFLGEAEDAEELEYFIDKLFEAEFLTEEIVVYDDRTLMPIMRAKDRASLAQLAQAGIKSPSGKPIEDLVVKRMAVVGSTGKEKMSPSWAAEIFLTNILFKVGLTNKDIIVLARTDDGALVHCVFDGMPILFYLTDSIPSESLSKACEDALDLVEKAHVIVISEAEITEEFVTSINIFRSVLQVKTVNDIGNMNADLAGVLGAIRRDVARNALVDINSLTSVDIAGLVISRLSNGLS